MKSPKLFVLERLISALATVFLAMTLAFLLGRLSGGDPARLIAGETAPEEQVEALRVQMGLDRPVTEQYLSFVADGVTGDVGESLVYTRPNRNLILSRVPWSLALAGSSLALGLLLGFPLGIFGALKSDTIWDRLTTGATLLGQSIPPFWLGLMLILIASVRLQWLPSGQSGGIDHFVLPTVALAMYPLAHVARIVRSAALDVIQQDYISAAYRRGLTRRRIIWFHIARSTGLPVLTVVGLQAGALLTSAVTVEYVFGWPGVGSLTAQAVQARDYTLIQALVVFGAITFVSINLVIDLTYSLIDPRVRIR